MGKKRKNPYSGGSRNPWIDRHELGGHTYVWAIVFPSGLKFKIEAKTPEEAKAQLRKSLGVRQLPSGVTCEAEAVIEEVTGGGKTQTPVKLHFRRYAYSAKCRPFGALQRPD